MHHPTMTAAGMTMHMAMINARASANALNQSKRKESSRGNSIQLTSSEIREIRMELGKFDSKTIKSATEYPTNIEEYNSTEITKFSICCTIV